MKASMAGNYNGFGKLFNLELNELRDRVIGEGGTNCLVISLFLTVTLPTFMDAGNLLSNTTDAEVFFYLLLWGSAILVQFIGLTTSIHIMTIVNKCGNDEDVKDTIKKIQSHWLFSMGAVAYYCSSFQAILTGIAVFYTAYLRNTSASARIAISIIAALCGAAYIILFLVRLNMKEAGSEANHNASPSTPCLSDSNCMPVQETKSGSGDN